MKKKYVRPKRLYNGSCKRSYWGWNDCTVHFSKGKICLVELPTGTKEYYKGGRLHRLDGPAVEYPNGYKFWYFNGEIIDVDNQQEFERYLNTLAFK